MEVTQNAEIGTQTDTETPEGVQTEAQEQAIGTQAQDTESGKPESEAAKETEIPESYTFPDDLGMKDEDKAKYSELFKKHKASQEAVNDFVEKFKEQAKEIREAGVKVWYDQVKQWGEEAANDKEYGGANFQKNIDSVIMPVISKFGDPKLIDELDKTGFGNNPRLLGMLYKIGKELGVEAEFVEGKHVGEAGSRSVAEIMYPTMFEKKQ